MRKTTISLAVSAAMMLPSAATASTAAPEEIHPGPYTGGGFPSTPVDFGVSADGKLVKKFTTRFKLDCKQGGSWVGELTVKRLVFVTPIPIARTARGGHFTRRSVIHYKGGGSLTVRAQGDLIAPDRAKGVITAHANMPGGVACKPFFGPIRWTARYAGA